MSIRKRLWNLARAELNTLLERVSDDARPSSQEHTDPDPPRAPARESREEKLSRYYANLELPAGAPWPEVKHAYRRLMRQYHPDRHHGDPEKARVATELSQELRVAYEALREALTAARPRTL